MILRYPLAARRIPNGVRVFPPPNWAEVLSTSLIGVVLNLLLRTLEGCTPNRGILPLAYYARQCSAYDTKDCQNQRNDGRPT